MASAKHGKHNFHLDKAARKLIRQWARNPRIRKVFCADREACRHRQRPGTYTVLSQDGPVVKVRVYDHVGVMLVVLVQKEPWAALPRVL